MKWRHVGSGLTPVLLAIGAWSLFGRGPEGVPAPCAEPVKGRTVAESDAGKLDVQPDTALIHLCVQTNCTDDDTKRLKKALQRLKIPNTEIALWKAELRPCRTDFEQFMPLEPMGVKRACSPPQLPSLFRYQLAQSVQVEVKDADREQLQRQVDRILLTAEQNGASLGNPFPLGSFTSVWPERIRAKYVCGPVLFYKHDQSNRP